MQNASIRILDTLATFLTTTIGTVVVVLMLSHNFLNYREQAIEAWMIYSWLVMPLTLYFLAIYIVVLLAKGALRPLSVLELPLLAIGCILILAVDYLFVQSALRNTLPTGYIRFWAFVLPNLFGFLGLLIIATRLKQPRQTNNLILWVLRVLMLLTIAFAFVVVNYSDFPGVAAPAEVRQRWADKEFENYRELVETIGSCSAVIDRVGTVRSIAPTQGKNYVVAEQDSSGHHGEFTLEVIGSKGTGITNFKVHILTSVSMIQFTSQDGTGILQCP
jgi:glucan phosphoethanolaminetransferase (alkaline phosphatase superfamily)